jgi:hypothetical protein
MYKGASFFLKTDRAASSSVFVNEARHVTGEGGIALFLQHRKHALGIRTGLEFSSNRSADTSGHTYKEYLQIPIQVGWLGTPMLRQESALRETRQWAGGGLMVVLPLRQGYAELGERTFSFSDDPGLNWLGIGLSAEYGIALTPKVAGIKAMHLFSLRATYIPDGLGFSLDAKTDLPTLNWYSVGIGYTIAFGNQDVNN